MVWVMLVVMMILLLLLVVHPFKGLFPGQSGQAGTRKVNHSGFYWSNWSNI